MFIGEMGCWLVVALSTLHSRYIASPRAEGYQPVSSITQTAPIDSPTPDEEPATNPLTKILSIPETDDRLPLKGYSITLLALPALCDILGTTLMNIGLLFVVASIYQMTRGALVLFVGLFSVLFLKRSLALYQWLALFTVVLGVGIVGVAGSMNPAEKISIPPETGMGKGIGELARRAAPEALRTIIGILLIAGAQIFTATQFVTEEWILEKYALEPLRVVGWEGTFGFGITAIGMGVMHAVVGSTEAGRGGYFDVGEGLRQMIRQPAIGWSSLLIMASIGYVLLVLQHFSLPRPLAPSILYPPSLSLYSHQIQYSNRK